MTDGVRPRMVASAVKLLAIKGLAGASFSEVLDDAQAPRGSTYHHFPGGKDELVAEAVDLAGARAMQALEQLRGRRADTVVRDYLDLWRSVLTRSELRAGCAVLAVTVETDSEALRALTDNVFTAWRAQLADLLAAGGVPRRQATPWAAMLVAATEGAVVLARAEGSLAPFELVAKELLAGTRQRMSAT